MLLALAGCGRGFMTAERPAWRHQAEEQCMRSGSVKLGAGIVQIEPIEGPGMCGADFPLKVAALGEAATPMSYSEAPRPPSGLGNSSAMPSWPPSQARYAPPTSGMPSQPGQSGQLRWTPGPPAIGVPEVTRPADGPRSLDEEMYDSRPVQRQSYPQTYRPPQGEEPAGRPVSLDPPNVRRAPRDDIPDDAILPKRDGRPDRDREVFTPEPQQQQRELPALGPMRAPQSTGALLPAALTPAATLSCPIVSALERWVTDGVQPAALHWFGSQVVTIKQISAYSCRGMVGAGTSHISEHAFGNALDIAGFTLADGRKISVQYGWRGTPEEQGFLHDVQLFACETFVTVLAPGYNSAHYNHIHVDLMRRGNGRRPCRPTAIRGEVAAAKARSVYAAHHGGAMYTGSIKKDEKSGKAQAAVAGADGLDDDDVETVDWPRVVPREDPRGNPALN